MRSATAAACFVPRSSRCTPGVRPASTGPVIAVRPCRTSSSVDIYFVGSRTPVESSTISSTPSAIR